MSLRISFIPILLVLSLKTTAQEETPEQWELPLYLREASGLVVTGEGYLYAHNDEKGNIYQVNLQKRSAFKLASIGKPPVRADFEGIAIADGSVYLVSSTGILYRTTPFSPDNPKQEVGARKIATGLHGIKKTETYCH